MTLTFLLSLFLTAFLAATVFPMQSEILLVAYLLETDISPLTLLLFASLGNILGSCVNWVLGRGFERFKHYKYFPVKEKSLARAQGLYQRYGVWTLLLSWMPFIGDPLTIIAGLMRTPFPLFLGIVTLAKTGRYIFVILVTLAVI